MESMGIPVLHWPSALCALQMEVSSQSTGVSPAALAMLVELAKYGGFFPCIVLTVQGICRFNKRKNVQQWGPKMGS
jgi:hypothetical protein